MSLPPPDDPRLPGILLQIARASTPVRLFQPRASGGGDGLLASARDPLAGLLLPLLGTLLDELPRQPGQARFLLLSASGLQALLRSTPAAQRAALARQVSPLYRDALLRAWKAIASGAEAAAFQQACAEHYGELLAPDPRPGGSGDVHALKRAMAKELVLSWERVSDGEARRALARAMRSLGLQEIGRSGDQVPFTGRLHSSSESLFQGDPVEIIEPGWTVADQLGEFLLRKAQVRAVASHA